MTTTAKGTAADPWVLKTPPLTSEFTMHRDTIDGIDMLKWRVYAASLPLAARVHENQM